ncbi:MAG: alginate O-acetyltransferase [Saprospiraceae bacterium]|nr:MAG: alginate O-acetyltransferase [Saprospiraceae bacterium]
MLFSSLLFLYVFLPVVLLLILLSPRRWHNGILLVASLFFYTWGGVSYSILLLGSILVNYLVGKGIGHAATKAKKKRWLVLGLAVNLALLVAFKYAHFLVENLNLLFNEKDQLTLHPIALPLGISFFTFQAISYLVDVYAKRTPAQQNLPRLALYISLFPQLIAGPIVRYHDIADQIRQRSLSWVLFASGIERFILGLGKKVLLANNFAQLADDIFAVAPENLDPLTAWVGLIMYSLQIYFDFSGYSDMAIGLGRMFGFHIPENFNFPYIARSIREFWRRWHISLSQWFRDYLYIPLGGNRYGPVRTYFNLLIVFFLTGLWHGASWNFVIWGLLHGFFMIIERLGFERFLARLGWGISHVYTLLVVLLAWVFFRAPDLPHALGYLQALFQPGPATGFHFDLAFYFGYELCMALALALLAATPLFRWMHQQFNARLAKAPSLLGIYDVFTSLGLMVIFLYCTMNLVTSAYNPFIYFRF